MGLLLGNTHEVAEGDFVTNIWRAVPQIRNDRRKARPPPPALCALRARAAHACRRAAILLSLGPAATISERAAFSMRIRGARIAGPR